MSDATTQWTDTDDGRGGRTREFRLKRAGRRDVTGAVWLPETPHPQQLLACFGHGASGDRYQAPIPYLALRFRDELGIPSLSIDGPVHGLRRVEPGGREALWPELQRDGVTDDMVEEWNTAVALAQSLPEIGTGRLVYFGLSMGSIFGIPFLATREDVIAAQIGLLGTNDSIEFSRRVQIDAPRVSCPLRFFMQLEDELFDRASCLRLFDAFAAEDKAIRANPGLHPAIPAEEIDDAFRFLRQRIEGKVRGKVIDIVAD